MQRYLGIEIGGTKIQVVAGDSNARILERRKFTVDLALGAAGICRQIQQAIGELTATQRPDAIGVGFGGPVDWKSGKVCRSHHVQGWSEFDLGGWLAELTGARVFVDNDGNVAALGEAHCGAGIGLNPVFYVTLGSGVGGGLVVDGRIYHGATPGESELGHVRLDRDGTTVESRCSGWAVDARVRELNSRMPSGLLARLSAGTAGAEARHLTEALRQGDAAADKILNEIAEDLALGLSHVVHLFHPEIIVVGGGLSGIGDPLREATARALSGFIMEAFRPGPRISLSKLGEDVVPVGALRLARGWNVGRQELEGKSGTELPHSKT